MNCSEWYQRGTQIDVLGCRVFYTQAGSGNHLICLHGFPTSSWDFASMWPELSRRFHVVAIDLVGLGKSIRGTHPISVSLQADVVEAILQQLGINNAHLLAHDLGDTVAQELLARQADQQSIVKWRSCVFLNGGLFPESHHARLIQQLLVSPVCKWVARLSSLGMFKRNMKNIFSPEHPPTNEFIEASWELIQANNGVDVFPEILGYMKERTQNRARWVGALEKNLIPMRLINGILDPVSGIDMAERYQEVVPDADVVMLEEAGHYPHVEQPSEVLRAFLDFHARLPENRIYN